MKELLRLELVTISLFVGLLSGCQKEAIPAKNVTPSPISLKAGTVNQNMYYFEFKWLDLVGETINGSRFRYLDLNIDSNSDFFISTFDLNRSSSYSHSSNFGAADLSFQIKTTPDSISPLILNYDDPIDDNGPWLNKNGSSLLLAYDNFSFATGGPHYENYNYWLNRTGYIAVRSKGLDGVYKYGWIRIGMGSSPASVTLYEHCFTK